MNSPDAEPSAVAAEAGTLFISGFDGPQRALFADDFVFHYYNTQLPELQGDYHGLDETQGFFERLHETSGGSFTVQPVSLTSFGDELAAAYVTNTLSIGGNTLEVDALVLWRVVNGKAAEAWDIPAVNTVRIQNPEAE